MSGPTVSHEEVAAVARWIDSVPRIDVDAADSLRVESIARGLALFNSSAHGCAGCHSGPQFTNNAQADVGTGGSFQVPSLIGLAMRAPYMHNGCARTLRDRFGACGGDARHGQTASLLPGELTDLIAYLETL
jgi:hypothetical protein